MDDISPDDAVKFLNEAERYFANRPTLGEDKAHWANANNAEMCGKIARLIIRQARRAQSTNEALNTALSALPRHTGGENGNR